jgi:hypothetical protein
MISYSRICRLYRPIERNSKGSSIEPVGRILPLDDILTRGFEFTLGGIVLYRVDFFRVCISLDSNSCI